MPTNHIGGEAAEEYWSRIPEQREEEEQQQW